MSQEDEIKQGLDQIQQALLVLDKKIENQAKRLDQLENKGNFIINNEAIKTEIAFSEVPLPPPPAYSEQHLDASNVIQSNQEESIAHQENFFAPASLEENIGGTWFMRIGIIALILGVSFFLKYAFDNNWIGEAGRVMIGIFIGLGMLGFGEKTIRKYIAYGQVVTGAGIAILYLSIFSAFNYYHLIGSFTAFFAMILITAAGIVLSLRYDAMPLMMAAIIGGFATPIMASTGQNNQLGLLSYVVLLDLAILAISVFKKWRNINVVGFVGTIILFSGWASKFYTKQDLNTTLFFLTLFFVIYSISSVIFNIIKKEKSTGVEQLLTLFSAVTYFGSSYALLNAQYHVLMGFFAILLALYYFLWAFMMRNFTPDDENLYNFLAFLTVGFVTIALPIQFNQNTITIGWAIEAVLLMLIGLKLKKHAIVIFSLVVSALTLFRYFFFDVFQYDQYAVTIFNKTFFSAIMIIGAFYLISYLAKVFSEEDIANTNKKSIFALFMILANILTIFAISREIVTSHEKEIKSLNTQRSREQMSLLDRSASNNYTYNVLEQKKDQEFIAKIEKIRSKSSISLSLFWLIYSIVLLVIGVVGKYKSFRVGGLVLLIFAIFKLFFVDLWNLGTLYRIISSISLGVVLMAISFVYQKYKDAIKEII